MLALFFDHMMRKYLPWLIGAVVVLTGGVLFAIRYNSTERPVPAATTEFDGVMAQMHEAYTKEVLDRFPEVDVPEKNESKLTVHGDVNLANASGGQKISFDLDATGKSDYSNPGNPLAESNVKISGEMKNPAPDESGEEVTVGRGVLEVGFKMVGQKVMVALLKAEAFQNGQEFPVALIVGPYLGKWYGGTFEEVNALVAQATGTDTGFRLENSFQSPNTALANFKDHLAIALAKVHLWKLQETLPEENGMLRYKVELDQEALKQSLFAFAELSMTNPDGTVRTEELNEAEAEIEKSLAEKKITLEGVLSVRKSDVQQFTFDGTLMQEGEISGDAIQEEETSAVVVRRLEEEFFISTQNAVESAQFELKDGKFTAMMNGKTVLQGTWNGDELEGTVMDENGTVASFHFEKGLGKEITGQISLPEQKVEINIEKFSYSDHSFALDLNVSQEGNMVFRGNLEYEISEVSEVTVEEPATLEPIQNLLSGFMGTLGSPAPGMPLTPPVIPDVPEVPEIPALPSGYEIPEVPQY